MTGTKNEIVTLTRKLLNRANTKRTISKQECMVLLSGIPLTDCSEVIQTVNIADSKRLSRYKSNTLMSRYAQRHEEEENQSFAQYFQETKKLQNNKKIIIPHFVGLRYDPIYPPTYSYARCTLLINRPWRESTSPHLIPDSDIIKEFNEFLKTDSCPLSVKASFQRVKTRYEEGRNYAECTNGEDNNIEKVPPEEDDANLLEIVNSLTECMDNNVDILGYSLDRGLMFDWGMKKNKVSHIHSCCNFACMRNCMHEILFMNSYYKTL